MCGKTRYYEIINDNIRRSVEITPTVEKMVEKRLSWFEHVERKPVEFVVRRVNQVERSQAIRDR